MPVEERFCLIFGIALFVFALGVGLYNLVDGSSRGLWFTVAGAVATGTGQLLQFRRLARTRRPEVASSD